MATRLTHLPRARICALLALTPLPLFAQTTRTPEPGEDEPVELQAFTVTGVRASLASAQEIKREKLEIVDSIVADDINKLPDYNVTDALQRITGIQILRDRGEGARVTIRGLSQMENTLNGREVFTAGLGYTGGPSRVVDFADIPSEMIAEINVYKTASADHIEGGIGGLVEMVTRRPFDFPGFQAIASVRAIHGDLVDEIKPQYSALASHRVKLSGGGEVGALVNVTFQERAWREDQKGTGTPTARTDIIPGETVNVQNSTSENTVLGTRERTGISGVVQWRPNDRLELYAEGNYAKFDTFQDTHQINLSGTGFTFVPGSAELAPGTNDLQRITWTNAGVSVLSFARDTHDWTKQFAVGGNWRGDRLALELDVSYTDSYNDLYFAGPFFAAQAAQFSYDTSTQPPSTVVTGTDLTDPSIYQYTGIAYRYRPYHGDLTAVALDGSYNLNGGFFHSLNFGARWAVRNANNKPGLIFADFNYPAASRPPAVQFPNLVATNPFGFFPGYSSPGVGQYMAGVIDAARDIVPYRALFGITTPLPETAAPQSLWDIDETTTAVYLMSKFKAGALPLEGNIGVRAVRTDEALAGAQRIAATPTTPERIEAIDIDTSYDDVLPSLNARYAIRDALFLKFSASKTLTRPDFNQLSPSLTLVPNPIDPAQNQGSAGNPELQPIEAVNYDLALEKYFNPTTYVYATIFYKDVDGFIISSAATETHEGQPYLITRPRNADPAKIKGFEVGYTQFFDFLPGFLSHTGIQANYTYIDSETPNATLGINTPLPNLSEHSYNIIGMYETEKISVRVAYNWRDEFLSGQANIANVGRIPFYTKDYGWLDASVSYRFNEHVSLSVEGTNLLQTERISYYGRETLPQNIYINDRQISVYASYRF